jgi:hypothetical protein
VFNFSSFCRTAFKTTFQFFSLQLSKHEAPPRHVLTLSKKHETVSFWESHKHVSQKDVARRFGIPTSTPGGGDTLKCNKN